VLEVLAPIFKARKCIPFIGSGVSYDSGIPSAKDFLAMFDLENVDWQKATQHLAYNYSDFERDFHIFFGDRHNRIYYPI